MSEQTTEEKIDLILILVQDLTLMKKSVFNFAETAKYLDVGTSHLYKLTSTKAIPHFCPNGKKLYFNREELDNWLQRNKILSSDELNELAIDHDK